MGNGTDNRVRVSGEGEQKKPSATPQHAPVIETGEHEVGEVQYMEEAVRDVRSTTCTDDTAGVGV